MREMGALLLVLVFLTASGYITPLPASAEPKTIIVPDDYQTINTAISQASDGDTIVIRNGIYTEQILEINKSLTITSEYVNGVIISLHPPQIPVGTPYGTIVMRYTSPIRIYADDVKISGLSITSDGGGISAKGNRIQIVNNMGIGVSITGNESQILGNTMAGIGVAGFNNTVRDNHSSGLSVGGSFNLIIKNDAGNIVLTGSKNVVDGNSFIENGGIGIWLIGANYNTITNNIEEGSNVGIAIGYLNPSGSYNIFAGNTIEGAIHYGIVLRNGTGNVFFGNRIANNPGVGLVVGGHNYDRETDHNLFFHNIFVNNTKNSDTSLEVNGLNFFDNGTEGNYWDDYSTRYPMAIELNHSGVGNTPYRVYTDTMDNYPLLNEPDVSSIVPALPDPWSQISLINPEYEPSRTASPSSTTGSFQAALILAVSASIIAIVGVGLLVYFRKRKS